MFCLTKLVYLSQKKFHIKKNIYEILVITMEACVAWRHYMSQQLHGCNNSQLGDDLQDHNG